MKLRKVEPNLYIQTNKSGTESWIARFYCDGKTTYRGLGDIRYVTKKQAREDMLALRIALKTGAIPLQVRTAPTFEEILETAINEIQEVKQWKNATNVRHQWEQSLRDYAMPTLGKMHVDKIEPDDIAKALRPSWTKTPVVSARVRMRIEAILNWCTVKKYRKGPNPAVWRGNLDMILPATTKVHEVKHHEAPSVAEVRKIVEYCRNHPSIVSAAILLIIATAGRVNECVEARRSEIKGNTWTVGAERMKAGKTHRVPLSSLAREALKMAAPGDVLFPGEKKTYISIGSPRLKLMMILNRAMTTHGIRSAFKDWCSREGVPEVVSEKALAHKWGNETTEAYLRDDLLERRRKVMQEWADAVGN